MKLSIAITLLITIGVFSYVSGYSIGAHNKQKADHITMASQTGSSADIATPAPESSAPSPGYGQ